jgi:integrase
VEVYRKSTVRWTLDGKRASPNTPLSVKETIPSKRWYGTVTDFDGKRRQMPLFEDRESSKTLLRRLQAEADHKRAVGVNRQTEESRRPLAGPLNEYESCLCSKGNTERHVTLTMRRIRGLVEAVKAKTLNDLDASHISSILASWRGRKRRPISIVTSNHYATAIKGFSRWLWMQRRTHDDILLPLRLLNAKVDRRHVRRALTPDELRRLIDATEMSRKTLCGLTSTDRAILYTLAAYTGLRASELASLTASSFDLDAKTVAVQACYSKRRRNDTLPLHASLVARLRPWLATRLETGSVWRRRWAAWHCANTARMLRHDLKRAGIAYRDEQGRYADFHALRHTFITQLARSGVHPAKAKALARHSTITLTMDVYSHVETDELRGALEMLPPLT